jgi:transcriptional regulator with XRE-family HTH domain
VASLRDERIKRLLSVRALAELAGVAPTTVHLIETGQRRPQFLTIHRISEAMGVDPLEVQEFRSVLEATQQRESGRRAGA